MNSTLFLPRRALLVVCLSPVLFLAGVSEKAPYQGPKLIVGIVVDQMRNDYLSRYGNIFTEQGGFRRLQSQGLHFREAHVDYVPTSTGPGHASIATGAHPSVHGIVGNTWYDQRLQRTVYCVEDESCRPVGASSKGNRSPLNLKVPTFGDVLKESTQMNAKVVSLSLKDRSAILMGGRLCDHVAWLNAKDGQFMASTYYGDTLPQWLVEFNSTLEDQARNFLPWEPLHSLEDYKSQRGDPLYYDPVRKSSDFRHDQKQIGEDGVFTYTPLGNKVLTDLAIEALRRVSLGGGEFTDLLMIGYSSSDYIGHTYGPESMEVADTFLRLDIQIGRLLDYLDATLGQENYVVFLTSDHGVTDSPALQLLSGKPLRTLNSQKLRQEADAAVEAKFAVDTQWVIHSEGKVSLNHSELERRGIDVKEVCREMGRTIMGMEGISDVLGCDLTSWRHSRIDSLIRNGYDPERSADIRYHLEAGYTFRETEFKGGDHGSGTDDDTHVPIIFYGKGIKAGHTSRRVSITDIFPSLLHLSGITTESGLSGRNLLEKTTPIDPPGPGTQTK